MATQLNPAQTRTILLDRRERLASTIEQVPTNTNLQQLLVEVDAALDRLTTGRYGICEICNEQIAKDQLLVDPLRRYCFLHLAPGEQVKVLREQQLAQPVVPAAPVRRWRVIEALRAAWKILRGEAGGQRRLDEVKLVSVADDSRERELEAIKQVLGVQRRLLPDPHVRLKAWELYFEYAPAGPVGGDYCDLVHRNTEEFFLFFGDVMGKGFAASKISSQLNGVFRALLDLKLPIDEMLERANRIFCERVQVIGYYATLVCGRASSTGTVELINAGHVPPLLVRSRGTECVVATGMPLGLFYASKYEVTHIHLAPGETLLFYTDGVTEARNGSDCEYGHERLARLATRQSHLAPKELVRACRNDVSAFTSKAPLSDDLTLLALRRV